MPSSPNLRGPLRVARIITRLNIGGPAIQAALLSAELRHAGFHTLLIHGLPGPREGDMSYLLPPKGVDTMYVPALRRPIAPVSDTLALAQIARALRGFRPAIVHTHMAKAGTLGRLAALSYNRTAGRSAPARLVHTYHGHVLEGYFPRRASAFFVKVEQWLARRTDALIAVSPQVRDTLVNTFAIGRDGQFHVVPLGLDLTAFEAITDESRRQARITLGIPQGVPVVTTVGRLTDIKQHDLFLAMAQLVAKRRPDAIFLIAGDGELRNRLERLATEAGLCSRVRFLGWRRDLPVIYGATDVFALTSRNEGTPVALIESMAAGVAGVSTDVGGVRDVITGADLGILVPGRDASALAEGVCRLHDAPDLRRQMGERGRRSVLARYSDTRLVTDIVQVYETLLRH